MYVKCSSRKISRREPPNPASSDSDLIVLLALREIEVSGPLTGLHAINCVASTAQLLGISPPSYALLHSLTEAGLLESARGKPSLYRITDTGSLEAERLAQHRWPRLRGEVVRLGRRLAPASPRARPQAWFVSEWVDESMDLSR